jgi:HEAT repeat protein
VDKAIHQLKRYRESPEAFEKLVELTTKHEDGNTRYYAMNALIGFRDFKLKKICEDRIINDPDYRLAQVALNIASAQKFPGFENSFLLACEHEHKSVRQWAVDGIGNNKIARGESLLLEIAKGDPERNIQYAALRSLTNGLKSYAVFPLLKEMLQRTDEPDRWNALNNLMMWKSNPDALDMLEPYRDDPKIGSRVIPHLEKYGR